MSRIERRTDRLSAGLDSRGLVDAVKGVREIDTTRRVYVKEWLHDSRHPSEELAQHRLDDAYDGRLHDGDSRIIASENGREHVLQTRRWNVSSEWKTEELALKAAASLTAGDYDSADVRVVVRNSRDEVELQDYGVKKLMVAR